MVFQGPNVLFKDFQGLEFWVSIQGLSRTFKVRANPVHVWSLRATWATREGHRTTVKRIAYEVNEQLDTATVDVLDEYK